MTVVDSPDTNLHRDLARHVADPAIELPDAGFTGVAGDYLSHSFVCDLRLLGRESRLVQLPRDEVPFGDFDLFLVPGPTEANHLQAVEKRPWNRVQCVRRDDEEHFGEVERKVEIVVPKFPILFRIENFEKNRRRRVESCCWKGGPLS